MLKFLIFFNTLFLYLHLQYKVYELSIIHGKNNPLANDV